MTRYDLYRKLDTTRLQIVSFYRTFLSLTPIPSFIPGNNYVKGWKSMKQVRSQGINASMYIHKYEEQVINSRSRPIVILGLNQKTIHFLSDLIIPPVPELLVGLELEGQKNNVIHLDCTLQWKQELGSFTLYFAKLHIHEEHRLYIYSQLNQMIYQLQYPVHTYFQKQPEAWTLARDMPYPYSRINTQA